MRRVTKTQVSSASSALNDEPYYGRGMSHLEVYRACIDRRRPFCPRRGFLSRDVNHCHVSPSVWGRLSCAWLWSGVVLAGGHVRAGLAPRLVQWLVAGLVVGGAEKAPHRGTRE